MSPMTQNIVYASLVIAGLIGLAALVDIITGAPFGGQTVFDIMFILAAGLTGFLGFDCIRESR